MSQMGRRCTSWRLSTSEYTGSSRVWASGPLCTGWCGSTAWPAPSATPPPGWSWSWRGSGAPWRPLCRLCRSGRPNWPSLSRSRRNGGCLPGAGRTFRSCKATPRKSATPWCPRISASARIAEGSCWIRRTGDTAIPSSTAPTAGHALPSSKTCPMTGP